MTVIQRRKDYVSERVYYHDAAIDTVEEDLLSLKQQQRNLIHDI